MALFYVLGALIIVIMNIGQLFPALGAIFRGAFNLKAAAGGVGGSIIALAIDLSDTFNGLMAIPNLIGVVVLCGLVRQITKNYTDRRLKGQTGLKPMPSAFPEIQAEQEKALAESEE